MLKLLIDTDIGNDIDDAVALCLALASPEVEVLAVTTVFQDPVGRARIAKALLKAAGRADIPVIAGEAAPLNNDAVYGRKIGNTRALHYGGQFSDTPIDGTDAVGFLIRTLERAEQPIPVVTIGALTNLAKVLSLRPDLKDKIAKFSIMGGAYDRNYAEFNFACDPEAAEIVLRSGVDCDLIGTDVTFRCRMKEDEVARLAKSGTPVLSMLGGMMERYGRHNVYLHDPLALYNLIDPDVLTFQDREVAVETTGKLTRGVAVTLSDWNWGYPPNGKLHVAVDVKAEAFVGECTRRLLSLEGAGIPCEIRRYG